MGPYPLQDDERLLWSGAPQQHRRWFFEHFAMAALLVLMSGISVWVAVTDPGSTPMIAR
jgi:hypothetical protein